MTENILDDNDFFFDATKVPTEDLVEDGTYYSTVKGVQLIKKEDGRKYLNVTFNLWMRNEDFALFLSKRTNTCFKTFKRLFTLHDVNHPSYKEFAKLLTAFNCPKPRSPDEIVDLDGFVAINSYEVKTGDQAGMKKNGVKFYKKATEEEKQFVTNAVQKAIAEFEAAEVAEQQATGAPF